MRSECDEFTSIGRLAVEALTAVGRSKGCIVILGFQDKAQINSIYDQNFASSLESMVGTVNLNTRLSAGGTSSTTGIQ